MTPIIVSKFKRFLPSCDVSTSYLGNSVDQNEAVNITGYNGISIGFSPIRKGNPYFEAQSYSGKGNFVVGFKIGSSQILVSPKGEKTFYVYDYVWRFTDESLHQNSTNYYFHLKHSFPTNETIGVGLCIENKTFVVVHNDTFEVVNIHYDDNSQVVPIVREIQVDNTWDNISFNFGTKFPFKYNFPGFSPFCLAQHLCIPTYQNRLIQSLNLGLIAVFILL